MLTSTQVAKVLEMGCFWSPRSVPVRGWEGRWDKKLSAPATCPCCLLRSSRRPREPDLPCFLLHAISTMRKLRMAK